MDPAITPRPRISIAEDPEPHEKLEGRRAKGLISQIKPQLKEPLPQLGMSQKTSKPG